MFLADSHMHSLCSLDAHHSMAELAEAAVQRGLSVITITDHVDLDHFRTGRLDGYSFDIWPDMLEDFLEANLLWGDQIELRLGLELGEAIHHPWFAGKISRTPGLDYIIGSLHNLQGMPDFYCIEYTSRAFCLDLIDRYLQEHLELAASPDIDVIGHIGYTRRYMKRAGFDIGYDEYTDALREIFQTAMRNGVGLELNTSGLRQGLEATIPTFRQIRLYRELGGEIVTVGSDAHFPRDVGADIAESYEMLREAGFRYVSVFRNRKPDFIKL